MSALLVSRENSVKNLQDGNFRVNCLHLYTESMVIYVARLILLQVHLDISLF